MVKQHPPEKDPLSGVETTGHEWDGIQELNNPAPRWWLWVFLVCVVWSIGYWIVYPAWPTVTNATKGIWSWTQHRELAQRQGEILEVQMAYLKQLDNQPLDNIHTIPALHEFSRRGGEAAFKENCAACHGIGGGGYTGYPNLNDDDWLFGGKLADIYSTIKTGIRSAHPQTKGTQMPAFGKDGILTPAQIQQVAEYVEKLSLGERAEKTPAYAAGEQIFTEQCGSCHGDKGIGNPELGAPRLSDTIWLYGGTHAAITQSISQAHAGVMPSWEMRLDDRTIKMLAVYIHSLGGGQE